MLSIAKPCFVLFVHVHKTYQNNLAIWAQSTKTEVLVLVSVFFLFSAKPTSLTNFFSSNDDL